MSFGFSIGDFITAISIANKIRKEFVDAPSQFNEIFDEVRSLSIILQDVDVLISGKELNSQQKTELQEIITGCHNVLAKLEETLGKYSEVVSTAKTPGGRIKRAWKRLKWEPTDISDLRNRIGTNVGLLNAFNGQLARDNMVKLVRYQNIQEQQDILNWLTPIDHALQQSDYISRQQAGTGQWFLNSMEFQVWLKNKQTLFCPGIPGAGKTILTSIVVEELYRRFQNDGSIGIAYLYCNFRQHHEQKLEDFLASLLKQLVPLPIPDDVQLLYERHRDKQTRPSLDEISHELHHASSSYSRVFVIIDALDECRASDGLRNRLLSEIFSLQAKTNANLLVTSRPIPEITSKFEGALSLKICASVEDVARYLKGHISRLPSFVSRSPKLQEEITREIIKAVDGMFLLAQLHLDSLVGKRSVKAIRTTLKTLPTGSEAYDHAYQEAMERIEGQVTDQRDLAKQVISWIICARRQLTPSEIQHALAVEIGQSKFDEDNLSEIEDIVSACAGLVINNEQSIQLVHYTAQEYFERTWAFRFPNMQRDIAASCITYLSFDEFNEGFCETEGEFAARLQKYPLYDYAAGSWGHHARSYLLTNEPLPDEFQENTLVDDLLQNGAKVSACAQALMASEYSSQRVPRQMTGVHLAAYFGLGNIVGALAKKGQDIDLENGFGRTPLSLAAENGHERVVKMMIDRDDVEVNSKYRRERTPLSWAAKQGYVAVVKMLLGRDDVEVNSKDRRGRTPLSWAAKEGHVMVVKMLLERDDVEVNSEDIGGYTPLALAATNGHSAVVKRLLDQDDVEADCKDPIRRTPLSWAAYQGHLIVVKMLLERDDVDADVKDIDQHTPLALAAWNGHEAVVNILLDRDDVEVDSKDTAGRTPLAWAAWGGHEVVAEILANRQDVNTNLKDFQGKTPLLIAANRRQIRVVKMLMDRNDVEIDYSDSDIQSCQEYMRAQ